MTNELAIRILTGDVLGTTEQTQEAVTMAVRALSQPDVPDMNVRDLISRQAAIDAMANTLWHYPNECYRNLNAYEFAKGLAELGLKSVPSAQPEITETQVKEYCEKRWLVVLTFDAFQRLKSAQPEREKGQWRYYDGMLSCSVCNSHMDDISPFCPMCGADMRG